MSSVQPLSFDATSTESVTGHCFHCGLPNPTYQKFEKTISGKLRQFCCPACEMVCSAIYDAGLEGFYDRTPENIKLAPPPDAPKDLALYDLDEVQAEFVDELGIEREIHLLVEGIHCAACAWLIERSLGQTPGITEALVNLAGKRLKVKWNNEQIKLSSIINQLAHIGYSAVPYDPAVAEGKLKQQNRALLFRMAFAGFAMMNLLWISIALYTGAAASEFRQLFHWVGFALATPTLLYSGYPFLQSAWTGLKRLHLTMDLPIAIGASVTYLYSVYITLSQSVVGEVYYDTVVNFLFVILVGRYLEAISKRQAVASTQRLLDLQPRGATVLRDNERGEKTETLLPIRAIKAGELILVRPGDRIPVDGLIVEGNGNVDESMLSGESTPVRKSINTHVSAGTLNLDNALCVKVEATLRNTSLGRIIHLVEEAQSSKAPIQCIADRIVPWFVAATLALASLTFIYWFHTDFELALMAATAVLIITCPCAFGLATPMSIASAAGLGARHGILIKNGAVLETLSHINHFVFDKTGTLTEGHMRVTEISTTGRYMANDLLANVAAIERFSEHSVAKAIVNAAQQKDIKLPTASDIRNQPGQGISGKINNDLFIVGSHAWMIRNGVVLDAGLEQQANQWENQGTSCVHVAINKQQAGIIAVSDTLRPDACDLIDSLRNEGIRVTLLSGDRKAVVEAIARQMVGMETIAEVLPEDKDRMIRKLQQQGHKVAMVGDGVNDAPALVRADVGIALGSGTDVSGDSADIVLISNELEKVWLALQLSKRTLRTIRQNIGISITYNIIMVPLAIAAFITPLVAAISMPISSLLVIGNATRIRTLFKKADK